jgi:hypothetical protein
LFHYADNRDRIMQHRVRYYKTRVDEDPKASEWKGVIIFSSRLEEMKKKTTASLLQKLRRTRVRTQPHSERAQARLLGSRLNSNLVRA